MKLALQQFILVLCLLSPYAGRMAVAADESLLQAYFDALRSRGLFVIAEEYAAAQLANTELEMRDRVQISIELARTFVDHGILQAGEQRQELWNEPQRTLQQADGLATSSGDKLQLDLWKSMLAATEGNAVAFQAVLEPERKDLRQSAGRLLRPAITALAGFELQLESSRQILGGFTQSQRQQWQKRIQVLCGESVLWLAEMEPAEAQRKPLLDEADRWLEKAAKLNGASSLGRRNSVLLARSARLREDNLRAEKYLNKAESGDPAPEILEHVQAERIRLDLSQGKIDVALQRAVDRLRVPTSPSDELRAEIVHALLRAAELARDRGDTDTAQQTLAEARQQHVRTYGIWRLQTTLLLQRFQQTQELGADLAALVRAGLAAWQMGEMDLAIEKYGAAAGLAFQTGQHDRAFEFAMTQSSIMIQEKRWRAAESSLGELVTHFPDHPGLAAADLLRCYALGQSQPHSHDYLAALQQHVARFPQSQTRGDAFWMLAVEAELQNQPAKAIDNYHQIPADNSRKQSADLRVVVLIEQLLQKNGGHAETRAALDEQISKELKRIVPPLLSSGKPFTPLECETLLQCLRLCLQHHPPLHQDADQILQVILKRIDEEIRIATDQQLPLDPAWTELKRTASQLQIISLASQKKLPEARQILQELTRKDPGALLSILSSLTDLTSRIDAGNLQELGALQRLTVEQIAAQRKEMSAEQKWLLDQASIQASIALQDWSAAIRTLEDLIAAHPQDVSLLRQIIDLSMKRGFPPDLVRARESWIQLEKLEKKGSPAWIEARINIAELQLQSGDVTAAKKLLGVTRTLYPQLGSPELQQRGERLWRQLNSQPADSEK